MESNSAVLVCPETEGNLKFSFVEINPTRARHLLGINHSKNRNVKDAYVISYANQIKAGQWHPSSCEAIKISDKGVLIDGQHRLQAVLRANEAATFLVIEGVPECAFTAIDDGAVRDLAAALQINGQMIKGGTQRIASAIKVLAMVKATVKSGQKSMLNTRGRVSVTEGVQFHKTLVGFNESINQFNGMYKHYRIGDNFNPPTLMALYYLFNGIDEATDEALSTICLSLESGVPFDDFKDKSPCYHAMNRIRKQRKDGVIIRAGAYIQMFIWMMDKTLQREPINAMPDELIQGFETKIDCVRIVKEKIQNL